MTILAIVLATLALPTAGQSQSLDSAAEDWDDRFGTLGMSDIVTALASNGTDVYAGGRFTTAGGVSALRIAKWDGSGWSALGVGVNNDVLAIAIDGSDVYAGGIFNTAGGSPANNVARWNGGSWSALGSGVLGDVRALATDGGDLYVGGTFTVAGGGAALRIAGWDGSWSALGAGLSGDVDAIAVDGSDVYVGGEFTTAGGAPAQRVARWNGSSWSALGGGVNDVVLALAIGGGDVYAGGAFTTAGGGAAFRVARWNGSSWSALGSGVSGTVYAIAARGSDVFVAGDFTSAGGGTALRVAKWDGSSWSALGTGPSNAAVAVATTAQDVFVGGFFTTVAGMQSFYIGRWGPPATPVLIQRFDARPRAEAVALSWEVIADEPIADFDILRARGDGAVVPLAAGLAAGSRTYTDVDVQPGARYRYQLSVNLPTGGRRVSQEVSVTIPSLPVSLGQNYPNPFRDATTIPFRLKESSRVTLSVYDVRGRLVKTLVDEALPAGSHDAVWDRRDGRGTRVASSTYFYRLVVDGRTVARRAMVLK